MLSETDLALAQIVAQVNGHDVSRGELRDAFDLVADKANWKNPIDATVSFDAGQLGIADKLNMIREAVIFFTGSVPYFSAVPGQGMTFRVKARGYYHTVGA